VRWILLPGCKILKSAASNLWKRASRLRACNRAIEVHRQIKVCCERTAKRARCGDCAALVTGGTKRHDRDHVNCADPWMDAATRTAFCRRRKVDRCHRKPRQRACCKDESVCFAHVGVDAAVMVCVVVNVE
jgi:hypothetical protein